MNERTHDREGLVAVVAERADRSTIGSPWHPVLTVIIAIAAVCAVGLAVTVAFADRALPRVTVAGIDVGGLRASEIRERLLTEAAGPWAAASVVVRGPDGLTWTTTNGALAIAPDVDRAVAAAVEHGKGGSLPQLLVAWSDALSGNVAVPFAMRAEGAAADAWTRGIVAGVDRRAQDGAIALTFRGVDVTPAVVGRAADGAALYRALLAPETLGDRELALRVHESYPAVDPSGIRDAAAKAIAATTALRIVAADQVATEDAAGLATLLVVEKVVAAPGELDAIRDGASAPAVRYVYRTRLDEPRVSLWVSRLAAALDHPAKNATYTVAPDGSLTVVPSRDGVKIDQPQLIAAVLARFFTEVTAPREIAPVFMADAATFTTEQATKYAPLMTPISTFTTTYPANAARHANITTGSLQFDDLVLAPGESFSFWDLLGPVTTERGYAFAGAIIDNRSDENVIGGGLCQVSTTLFNAVARAGFEILERHAHGYYIDRYPLGFDAAVFEPGVDFRWRNDTQYPVLIKAYPYAAALRFDLVSVPNGRRVVIGDAYQWNLKNPAPDQPADPAYPPGASVQGRDVSRTWTVWEGDVVVHEVTFASHYVPVWGGPLPAPPAPAKP